MAVLTCEGLTKIYGEATVVDGLTLSIERGEVFGFVGPNGAGKTTTIRMLLGLSRPDAGVGELLGTSIPPPPSVLARVGTMVEEPAFYPWMTASQHLAVLNDSCCLRVPREKRDGALARAGLRDVGRRPIRRYSQGMRQRLGLAAALMREPELLILDEPANGLDPAGIAWLRDLIRELADGGATVFLSSHQLGEVERVCDRVAIIDRGRLVHVAPTVCSEVDEQRVRVIVRAEDHAATLAALTRFSVSDGQNGTLYVTGADPRVVGRLLADRGVYPETIDRARTSLEQRFLDLTSTRP